MDATNKSCDKASDARPLAELCAQIFQGANDGKDRECATPAERQDLGCFVTIVHSRSQPNGALVPSVATACEVSQVQAGKSTFKAQGLRAPFMRKHLSPLCPTTNPKEE